MLTAQANGAGTSTRLTTLPADQNADWEVVERPTVSARTVNEIKPSERGDRNAKDQQTGAGQARAGGGAGELAVVRRRLATSLLKALDRARKDVGGAALAASIQLVNRELSRCHEQLGQSRSEANFMSLVVLAESALVNRSWKDLTEEELEALRRALAVGAAEEQVTYDHYNRAFRTLHAANYRPGPTFDLTDDLPDDAHPTDAEEGLLR